MRESEQESEPGVDQTNSQDKESGYFISPINMGVILHSTSFSQEFHSGNNWNPATVRLLRKRKTDFTSQWICPFFFCFFFRIKHNRFASVLDFLGRIPWFVNLQGLGSGLGGAPVCRFAHVEKRFFDQGPGSVWGEFHQTNPRGRDVGKV